MAALKDDLARTHAHRGLLTALGVDESCLSLRLVLSALREISKNERQAIGSERVDLWAKVPEQLQGAVEEIIAHVTRSKERAALAAVLANQSYPEPFRLFVYRAQIRLAPKSFSGLDQLLIVLLCTAASGGHALSQTLSSGLRQAYQSLLDDRRNAWTPLAHQPPLQISGVESLLKQRASGATREFLKDCAAYLATSIGVPDDLEMGTSSQVALDEPASAVTGKLGTRGRHRSDRLISKSIETGPLGESTPWEPSAPTIGALVRSAQIASLAAKAGVFHLWDSLAPADLAYITRKLDAILTGPDVQTAAMAAMAQLSLLLRANPRSARLTRTADIALGDEVEVWIDIDRGSICWRHAAYTNAVRPTNDGGWVGRINVIPLPRKLARYLRRARSRTGRTQELHALLDAEYGAGGMPMAVYNAFLRALGDDAHAAEPTRFASSAGGAMLFVTGSDMAAAQLCFRFEAAAPSALFYFNPGREWVCATMGRLYEYLGLDEPEPPDPAWMTFEFKSLDLLKVKSGWSRLVADILDASRGVQRWRNDAEGIEALNRLAPLCCSGFHIGCAGRASEPARITEASVRAAEDLFVLLDKMTDGIRSARLLPHTSITKACLTIFLVARAKACEELRIKVLAPTTESLFARLDSSGLTDPRSRRTSYCWVPIEANVLSGVAKNYFQADLNFQRQLWVTALGEAFANRWLIRVLTGHGSNLTRAFAPTMNVAPREGCAALACELDQRAAVVLGDDGSLARRADALPAVPMASFAIPPRRETSPSTGYGQVSSDPLVPFDLQCVSNWLFVARVRKELASGMAALSLYGQALLSLGAVSGITNIDASIGVCTVPDSLGQVGSTCGASWTRRHYVHNVWIPLQSQTRALLARCKGETRLGHQQLVRDVEQWIRGLSGFHGWSAHDGETLARFWEACADWRRIELPPSTNALACQHVETACLSPRSLHRLATGGQRELTDIAELTRRFRNVTPPSLNVHDFSRITKALTHWKDDRATLGNIVARGRGLARSLDDLGPWGTPLFQFARLFCRLEAEAMIQDDADASEVSTLATRFSALRASFEAYEPHIDPNDFETEEWVALVNDVHERCIDAMEREDGTYVIGKGKRRSDRARDALQRLFRVLERDAWEIPIEAWAEFSGAVVKKPRLSASSTIVFDADITGIDEDLGQIFIDTPLLAQSIRTKTAVMYRRPLRIGETSCAPWNCVTESDNLTLPTTDFSADKTTHATRTIPLDQPEAKQLRALAQRVRGVKPNAAWLFRFDAMAASEDAAANGVLAELIRLRTGDDQGRPHCLRAIAYAEWLWPGWRPFMTRFLQGDANAQDCRDWLLSMEPATRWIRAISAASAAGHGAVDSGFMHYAAVWPLIYAVQLCATTLDYSPGSAWRTQFGLTDSAREKAQSRAGGRQRFDEWHWIADRREAWIAARPVFAPPTPAQSVARTALKATPRKASPDGPHTVQAMRYLVLHGMTRNVDASLRDAKLGGRLHSFIESHHVPEVLAKAARKRRAGGIAGAALSGDRDTAMSSDGTQIYGWLLTLPRATATKLDGLFRRDAGLVGDVESVRAPGLWLSVTDGIPTDLYLSLRFGPNHLSLEEQAELERHAGPYTLASRDPYLGALPMVMLRSRTAQSEVAARRLTAVARLACLARGALDRVDADWLRSGHGHRPPLHGSPDAWMGDRDA